MSLERSASALLIAFSFFLLGWLFEYSAVLRRPVGAALSRFAGRLRLKLRWCLLTGAWTPGGRSTLRRPVGRILPATVDR